MTDKEKLYQLIQTGESQNIELAIQLAEANKISLEEYENVFRWLNEIRNYPARKLLLRECLKELVECTHLYLQQKGVKEIIPNIHRAFNLEWLYLDGNELEELPNSFGQLQKLRELN